MEWHKKTDEQYDAYVKVMMGRDNENEIHNNKLDYFLWLIQFNEEDWNTVIFALSNLIDTLKNGLDFEVFIEDLEYQDGISKLDKIVQKIFDIEEFDNSPIHVYELDHKRLLEGKESVIDFIDRKKREKKQPKEED